MIYAVLIGIVTSFVSTIFNFLVENLIDLILSINNYFFDAYYFPIVGGLILGLINKYIIVGNREFEIVAIEEEISDINNQFMKYKDVLLKTIASIVSLSFGFSLGKQGTIIYLGGAVGSFFGFELKARKEDIKTYIGCGVAGMISGVFGLPLLGIVLVNEVLIGYRTMRRFLLIIISVITSHFVFYGISHNKIFITIFSDKIDMINFDIKYAILFGVLSGIISMMYNFSVNRISDNFLKEWPFLTSLVAGIIICIIGLNMKEIYILHYDVVKSLLFSDKTIIFLLIYIFIKIILTGISYNFGGYGGVFLPGVIIGAVLGKSYFLMTGYTSMNVAILIGIAAVFTGFSGGPISGAILGFELSGYNIELIVPFLIVNYICYFIVKRSRIKFLY